MTEHIQDEFFLNGLKHGVEMKGRWPAVITGYPEHLQGLMLGRGGKGVKGDIGLPAPALGLFQDQIFQGGRFRLAAIQVLGLGQGFFLVQSYVQGDVTQTTTQHPAQTARTPAALAGMGLIDNHGKAFIRQVFDLTHEKGEFLQGGDDDLTAPVQLFSQISSMFFLINQDNQSVLMLYLIDGILELFVQVSPVRDHNHRRKDRLVLLVTEAGQLVGCPGNGIGLATACRMLDQVVLPCPLISGRVQ